MGGYASKCEKKSKSLHPTVQFITSEKFISGVVDTGDQFPTVSLITVRYNQKA
jgi:hypothetical protein